MTATRPEKPRAGGLDKPRQRRAATDDHSSAVLPSVLLLCGASSQHARKWAVALAERGHPVIAASWLGAEPIDGVDLRVAPGTGRTRHGRWGAVWQLAAVGWWLRRQVRESDPDVLHVHSVGMAGLLSLLAPRRPARVITPWGVDLQSARRSRVRRWVARAALHRADLVLPTAESVRTEILQRYRIPANRTRTVSWGVADNLFELRDTVDKDVVRRQFGIPVDATVLFAARTAGPVYRTSEVLRAFAGVAAARPDLHLVVLAGHRPAEAAAAQAQRKCVSEAHDLAASLPGRVTVVDRPLTPEDTFRLMRASEVSISVPRFDQRSCTVLEAALAGCRLLLADLPPYHEMVADGMGADIVVGPLEAALSERFLAARPLEPRLQQQNRQFIETSESWSRQVAIVQECYQRLTSDRAELRGSGADG
ncbi:glycosyltransferase family 4 protein [Micromonospora sp. CPCC 205539]|uniref:glycosyltransferase family 4 protein n=1 Tax=Micromonospora sp. CPCC 205539 TaxID=3122408 RepID=UPI002FF2E5FD